MNDKLQKIKNHLAENKTTYLVGGVCLVAGAAGGALAIKTSPTVQIRAVQILTWKSKQTIEVFVEALGDPGNIIQDTTTGTIYASQNQAARALGVNRARISEHLAGRLSDVSGHTFENLGKAAVTQ